MRKLSTIFLYIIMSFNILKANIIVTSIPKSGTHLIARCVCLLTARQPALLDDIAYIDQNIIYKLSNDTVYLGHLLFNESNEKVIKNNEKNLKFVFIIRDPRDQIISHLFWIYEKIDNPMYANYRSLSFDDALSLLIREINDFYGSSIKWKDQPYVYVTKFEDLIGSRGGGSDKRQYDEITNIAKYLRLTISTNKCKNIASQLFGQSVTFRVGKIGSWKTYFNDYHKNLFKEVANKLLIDLGYEKEDNW